MKYLNMNTLEATHFTTLKIGERMVIMRPVKPQPEGLYFVVDDGKLWFDDNPWREVPAPLPPGSLVALRETTVRFTGCGLWGEVPWMLSPDGDPYQARLPIAGNEDCVQRLRDAAACVTIPSILMPIWACRLFANVVSVECRQLSRVDSYLAGIEAERAKDYETRFGCDSWVWITTLKRRVKPNDRIE
jgi:hypothetical protein